MGSLLSRAASCVREEASRASGSLAPSPSPVAGAGGWLSSLPLAASQVGLHLMPWRMRKDGGGMFYFFVYIIQR